MNYAKRNQEHKRFVENPSPMIVYNGTSAEGEIEDHGRGDIRAFLGIGDERVSLGTYPDRKAAMRAVSDAVTNAAEGS